MNQRQTRPSLGGGCAEAAARGPPGPAGQATPRPGGVPRCQVHNGGSGARHAGGARADAPLVRAGALQERPPQGDQMEVFERQLEVCDATCARNTCTLMSAFVFAFVFTYAWPNDTTEFATEWPTATQSRRPTQPSLQVWPSHLPSISPPISPPFKFGSPICPHNAAKKKESLLASICLNRSTGRWPPRPPGTRCVTQRKARAFPSPLPLPLTHPCAL